MTRAGFVTVVGKPNAGKSTLLNRIVGQKLSITSPKPQTTRDRVVGIWSDDTVQMVLFDTPGLLDPEYALQSSMRATALKALRDGDLILYMADATAGPPPSLQVAAELGSPPGAPVVLALNKIDRVDQPAREALIAAFPDAHLISARTGEGVEPLLRALAELLPESPFLYPDDEISTQPLRFFAAEMIRETALEQLDEEVPYSIACEIEEFREDRTPLYIRAVIYVERDSQRGIVIGARGARVRDIGQASRIKLEALVGAPVYLDLWVKVLPNWRRKPAALRRFGYGMPPAHGA